MQNAGFSIPEALLFAVFASVLFIFASQALFPATKVQHQIISKGLLESALADATEQIIRVGRLASSCLRISAVNLTCKVDKKIPPSGITTEVRFLLAGSRLVYQEKERFWKTLRIFGGTSEIFEFIICDDGMMATIGRCPLEPQKINQTHTNNMTVPIPRRTEANKFFRFKLTARTIQNNGATFTLQQHGSFFSRNPVSNNLVYQWGTKE